MNPYGRNGYGVGASSSMPHRPGTPGNVALPGGGNGGGYGRNGQYCGLPGPTPAGPCPDAPGQRYCRQHAGGVIALAAGATGVITVTPVNAVEFVARWLHMTATSAAGVSPQLFTQAFTITAITILGDNQLANAGPVIGSTWSAEQNYLEVWWNRVITATNPLTITVVNLDPVLAIRVFASVAGDGVKS